MTYCANTQCPENANCTLYFDCPLFKPTSKKPKVNKYQAQKCVYNGIQFDSKREANRYAELLLLSRSGQITGLKRQVKFELIPAQKDEKGKCVERAVSYIADFVYQDENGRTVIEDTKGMRTEVYKIKKKLMLYKYGIKIREI